MHRGRSQPVGIRAQVGWKSRDIARGGPRSDVDDLLSDRGGNYTMRSGLGSVGLASATDVPQIEPVEWAHSMEGEPSPSSQIARLAGPDPMFSRRSPASVSPAPNSARRRHVVEVEQTVKDLDERVNEILKAESSQIPKMLEQFSRLNKEFEQMKIANELQREKQLQTLKNLESTVARDIDNAKKERNKQTAALNDHSSSLLEEAAMQLRVTKETNAKEEEDFRQQTYKKVDSLERDIEKHAESLSNSEGRFAHSLTLEFEKLHSHLQKEKGTRNELESEMSGMMNDVKQKLKGEIEQERQERKAVLNRLLELLEETCGRIEESFQLGR